MATSIETLKRYFLNGKKPTEDQFEELIDSFVHRNDDLQSLLGAIAELSEAEEGIITDKYMTPFLTKAAIVALTRLSSIPALRQEVLSEINTAIDNLLKVDDADNIINTLGEVIQAFNSIPEGVGKVMGLLNQKENTFSKNTAFNKNFGSGSNAVPRGTHNHDDRYYTESEISEIIDTSYITKKFKYNLPIGWYTIATNTGDRAVARFGVWEIASNRHQTVIFYASHIYGKDASNTITVLQNSKGYITPIKYIRILDRNTYEGAALQIYIDDNENTVHAAILGDNIQSSGWVLKDWIPNSQNPGDVDNYTNFGERSKIDLDLIDQGGIVTTGPMYADGDLQQYKVVTFNDKTDSISSNNSSTLATSKAIKDAKDYARNWNNLTNKPTSFNPNSHTHTPSQVGLGNIPNAKSDSISSNNSSTLATSKAIKDAKDYARNWNNLTNKPTSFNPNSHTHTPSQVGLGNIPNAKSDSISSNNSSTLATSKALYNLVSNFHLNSVPVVYEGLGPPSIVLGKVGDFYVEHSIEEQVHRRVHMRISSSPPWYTFLVYLG